jgi:hypothetical protein
VRRTRAALTGVRARGNADPEVLAQRDRDRAAMVELFDRFDGRLVSPGGAAGLLGVTRATIYSLGRNGALRVFRSDEQVPGGDGRRWVYIPLADVEAYAEHVGRPLPRWARR